MEITVNGNIFNYQIDGLEDAPWVIFSNSLATDLRMWDGQVEVFKNRYRILRYDTRGHGRSAASTAPYTFDLLVSDVIGLMNALSIEKAHYVGLSLGGMTGLGVALGHGDRLLSLTVCDARALAETEWAEAWNDRIATVREMGMEPLVEPTIGRWFTEACQQNEPQMMDKVRSMIRQTSAEGYIGCALALQKLNYIQRLGEITLPTLFMTGASDHSTPPEAAKAMHGLIKGSTCVIVDPASHISNMENPGQFDRALAEHLDSIKQN